MKISKILFFIIFSVFLCISFGCKNERDFVKETSILYIPPPSEKLMKELKPIQKIPLNADSNVASKIIINNNLQWNDERNTLTLLQDYVLEIQRLSLEFNK